MKIWRSELGHSYKTYSFGYTEYVSIEPGDKLSEIYARGFLPFSGSPEAEGVFYMARSVRVPLHDFKETSENRRILKKFETGLIRKEISIKDFEMDEKFENFCLEYFKKRHGPSVMPRKRFHHILEKGPLTHIVSYSKDGETLGFVLLAKEEGCLHFWFSFYDLSLVKQSLGMYLMLDAVRSGKKEGLKYAYLGTAYGEKGLYKLNFPGLEFWDGAKWNQDMNKLKSLCRSDDKRVLVQNDLWKEKLSSF